MEKEKINNLIAGYARDNLSPKKDEREMISKRYDEIQGLLIGNEIFQSGSYARFTSITPVSDLDIIWIIPRSIIDKKLQTFGLSEKAVDPRKLKLSDILVDLANKLENEYSKIGQKVKAKPQAHSVGIYFGSEKDFSIDIVPAVKSGEKNEYNDDIYHVPEDQNSEIIWIKSDPRGYIKEAQNLNNQNDYFRKSSKFVKKWKQSCEKKDELFPLKSFHLETICKEIIKNNRNISIFDILHEFYSELDLNLSEPRFPDRANPEVFIDDYVKELTEEEIELVTKMKNKALTVLDAIMNSDNTEEVIQSIKVILNGEENLFHRIGAVIEYAVARVYLKPSWQKPLPWPNNSCEKIGIRCFLDGAGEILPKKLLFPNHKLRFLANFSGSYDEIYWQVVNTGEHAMNIGEHALRGDYFKAKDLSNNPLENPFVNWERTAYHGSHWISCFAVLNGVCVAVSDPFYLNIYNRSYLGYKKPRRR